MERDIDRSQQFIPFRPAGHLHGKALLKSRDIFREAGRVGVGTEIAPSDGTFESLLQKSFQF